LYLSASTAVGGAIEAVKIVCDDNEVEDKVDSAFAIVRPPGHHAKCSHDNEGFCFFNNVAVAAVVAQQKYNKQKIVIFDWDVHFGDGTSEFFYQNENVLVISIHRFERKFYPGNQSGSHERIGKGNGKGYNINFPF
jgi:histone deacetylase 6